MEHESSACSDRVLQCSQCQSLSFSPSVSPSGREVKAGCVSEEQERAKNKQIASVCSRVASLPQTPRWLICLERTSLWGFPAELSAARLLTRALGPPILSPRHRLVCFIFRLPRYFFLFFYKSSILHTESESCVIACLWWIQRYSIELGLEVKHRMLMPGLSCPPPPLPYTHILTHMHTHNWSHGTFVGSLFGF